MYLIFQGCAFATRLEKRFRSVICLSLSRLESHRIVEHEAGVLFISDFLFNNTFPPNVMRYSLNKPQVRQWSLFEGSIILTARSTPNTWLMSEDFPTPDYESWLAIRVKGVAKSLTLPTAKIRNLSMPVSINLKPDHEHGGTAPTAGTPAIFLQL